MKLDFYLWASLMYLVCPVFLSGSPHEPYWFHESSWPLALFLPCFLHTTSGRLLLTVLPLPAEILPTNSLDVVVESQFWPQGFSLTLHPSFISKVGIWSFWSLFCASRVCYSSGSELTQEVESSELKKVRFDCHQGHHNIYPLFCLFGVLFIGSLTFDKYLKVEPKNSRK